MGVAVSPTLTAIDRSDAGKLAVTGPDALPYLQALLSADLAQVSVGGGCATALLTPRGQVRALGRALRFERGWLLQCERPALEGLFRGLWNGRIGWNVTLRKLTLQQGLVSLVGEGEGLAAALGRVSEVARSDGAEAAPIALAHAGEHGHLPTAVAGIPVRAVRTWAGIDLLARADQLPRLQAALAVAGAQPLDRAGWDALRIARGRLLYGADASEATLPAELALDAATVATDKGLYPGLQTVLRQQRSGTVHRRICRLRAAHALLAPGDELTAAGRAVGRVTSALAFDGLGLVRASAGERLVHAPTGTAVRATALERAAPSL
jgi:folate-binding Fe-S cluster repair protein YgfZ